MIDRITAGREPGPAVLVGPGDDAAVVAMPDARVVVTTDMLVQGRHFRTDWSTPQQIGGKAIAQNGADIAAMGARPQGYVVALGCPPDTPLAMLDALNEGMRQEAMRSGAEIVGGDLVQSPEIVVSVTALGDLEGRVPVLRSGARIGDVVAVAGTLGRSAAGMAALEAGMSGSRISSRCIAGRSRRIRRVWRRRWPGRRRCATSPTACLPTSATSRTHPVSGSISRGPGSATRGFSRRVPRSGSTRRRGC